MAKYRIIDAPTFINNTLEQPEAIVEFDGKPGKTLELIEEEKPKRSRGPKDSEE